MLALYNFTHDDEDSSELLPVGTHLALIAPYMKNARENRQGVPLR